MFRHAYDENPKMIAYEMQLAAMRAQELYNEFRQALDLRPPSWDSMSYGDKDPWYSMGGREVAESIF